MLDLETLGNRPGSVIVSVGAARFGDDSILGTFYEVVDASSCTDIGLRMDTDTVMWWMKQNSHARKALCAPGAPIKTVLARFSAWCMDADAEVWGNGADFDCAVMSEAYAAAGMPRPWKYYNSRCYRTLKSLARDLKPEKEGVRHNALDDAITQAKHAMAILGRMGGAVRNCGAHLNQVCEELGAAPGEVAVDAAIRMKAEVGRLKDALEFTLSCLKHHHITRGGISTLVEKAEAIAEKGKTNL